MSDEEINKIEFIIEQQAQFAANMQEHDARFTQLEELVTRLATATLEGFKDVNAKIDALVDSQIRLTDAQSHMAASQAETSEKLKNLIAVVDRYFSERRNGESQQ